MDCRQAEGKQCFLVCLLARNNLVWTSKPPYTLLQQLKGKSLPLQATQKRSIFTYLQLQVA